MRNVEKSLFWSIKNSHSLAQSLFLFGGALLTTTVYAVDPVDPALVAGYGVVPAETMKPVPDAGYMTALSNNGSRKIGVIISKKNDGANMVDNQRAAIWDQQNVEIDLGAVGGFASSEALAISSDSSTVVGAFSSMVDKNKITFNDWRAVVWYGDSWSKYQQLSALSSGGGARAVTTSADGALIGGTAIDKNNQQRAVVWARLGNYAIWQRPIDLGTLAADNSGTSSVSDMSSDGSVIVGQGEGVIQLSGATVVPLAVFWRREGTNNWSKAIRMATSTLSSDGRTSVAAVSGDGNIAVGQFFQNNSGTFAPPRAAFWWGANFENLAVLRQAGTNSQANAVSFDGSIIGGLNRGIAAIWSRAASNPSNPALAYNYTALTLLDNTVRRSNVRAVSDDGSVASGTSGMADGSDAPVVWKLSASTSDLEPITVLATVDVEKTLNTVSKLGAETFGVMELQRQALLRLQDGCIAYGRGNYCYSIIGDYYSQGDTHDTALGFSLGYALTDNLSVGAVISRSLSRSLPDSFKRNNNNVGVGIYAEWHSPIENGHWYVRPSLSLNQYDMNIKRRSLENTEDGTGKSKVKGWAAAVEGGQSFVLQNGNSWGWHVGVRQSDISRDGYTEDHAYFPAVYDDINYRDTSVFVGADAGVPLSPKVTWLSSIELEQGTGNGAPVFKADVDYIGRVNQKADISKTRGYAATGLKYSFDQDVSVSLMPNVSTTALGDTTWGVSLKLEGKF